MVAVAVFFVLSGYVIAFSVERKREDFRAYTIARTSRIYSVVLPALLLTAALGAIGQRLYPDASWGEQSVSAYVSSATFLNNIWLRNVSPGNDGPYWSVCYEVWYYAFFGRHRLCSEAAKAAAQRPACSPSSDRASRSCCRRGILAFGPIATARTLLSPQKTRSGCGSVHQLYSAARSYSSDTSPRCPISGIRPP